MNMRIAVVAVALVVANVVLSQERTYPRAKVSFEDYKAIVAEVEAHRASRLIDLETFVAMSQEPGVVVLDARSALRYERIHVKGATNLSFTEFTEASLKRVIPSLDTKILIYCNNNFDGNQADFATKAAPRLPSPGGLSALPSPAREEPLMMALNIPTYINLYGYGYRNVYELDELVHVRDPRVVFEGSTVDRFRTAVPPSIERK
jgi:rhodanese-related sulfurtransferase